MPRSSRDMFNCIIMGAAGRDFHDFRTFFVDHPEFYVCAFTATQIPFIVERSFPQALAGEGYDVDIPIYDEQELPGLIDALDNDFEDFGNDALIFEVNVWVHATSERGIRLIRSDLRYKIDELFRENAVVIAFPQRDVHVDGKIMLQQVSGT